MRRHRAAIALTAVLSGSAIACQRSAGPERAHPSRSSSAAVSTSAIQEQDGTRLKIRRDGGTGDGELWDSTLRFGCTIQRAADRGYRCLPPSDASESGVIVHPFFVDASCTQLALRIVGEPGPVVSWRFGPWFPAPALRRAKSQDAESHHGEVEPTTAPSGEIFETGPLGTCGAGSKLLLERRSGRYYRVKRSLSVEDFAPVELVTRGSGRLREGWAYGADGVHVRFDFMDTALGTPCRFADRGALAGRCVPYSSDAGFDGVYVDSACTMRGVVACSWTGLLPSVGRWLGRGPNQVTSERAASTGDPTDEFGKIAAALESRKAYRFQGSGSRRKCESVDDFLLMNAECTVHRVDAVLGPTDFAVASSLTEGQIAE